MNNSITLHDQIMIELNGIAYIDCVIKNITIVIIYKYTLNSYN